MPALFRNLLRIGVALIAGIFIVAWLLPKEPPPPEAASAPPRPAARPAQRPAPPLELPRVDGGKFSLAGYRGKSPVVLFFFATWCPHCREETPHLLRFYQENHPRGVQFVAISSEAPATVRAFLKEHPLPFPVLYDKRGKAGHSFGVEGIPLTCVVDRRGRLVDSVDGFVEEAFWKDFVPHARKMLIQ